MSETDLFTGIEFDLFKKHILKFWRPKTEAGIIVEKDSQMDKWLSKWFKDLEKSEENLRKINVELYVGIHPYGRFEIETPVPKKPTSEINLKTNIGRVEYLFMYDDIDNSKMTAHQLTLGREDFVDLD